MDYVEREQRLITGLKSGEIPQPSKEVATRFAKAKLAMNRETMADTMGGLLGADAVRDGTEAQREYEAALTALEAAVIT